MDKKMMAQTYKEWLEQVDEGIEALQDWRAQLPDWQDQVSNFDAVFRVAIRTGGPASWFGGCTAGSGVDKPIIEGGDVCVICGGTGMARYTCQGVVRYTCPTCGKGAIPAGEAKGE